MANPKWIHDAIFYEIYPNSFYDANGDGYGDFKGMTEKLDYIKSLGCNAIWLNPHYKSAFMDGGYDVVDFCKVSERYGTEAEFDEFLSACHAKGIRLIVDLVAGHTSELNADFLKSAEPTENEMTNRFVWTKSPWDLPEGYRFVSGRHQRHGNYLVNFFSTQPALNYGFNKITHPEWQMSYKDPECLKTREWLKNVIRFWLNRGVDGFRVDMADSLVKNDDDKTATIELWQDVSATMHKEFPEAVLVSEWSSPRSVKAGFDIDFMLDHWGNPYNSLVRHEEAGADKFSYFNQNGKGDAKLFATGFTKWFKDNANKGYIGVLTCNHDTPRLAPYYTPEQLKVIYAFLFSLPGVPFVYYGDEIGMKYQAGMPSVECGFQRTGTRTPMQWTGGTNAGFSVAAAEKLFLPVETTPNVESQEKDDNSLLNAVRKILKFRSENDALKSFDFEVLHAKGSEPIVCKRENIIFAVNPLAIEQTVRRIPQANPIFSVNAQGKIVDGTLTMPPLSYTAFAI